MLSFEFLVLSEGRALRTSTYRVILQWFGTLGLEGASSRADNLIDICSNSMRIERSSGLHHAKPERALIHQSMELYILLLAFIACTGFLALPHRLRARSRVNASTPKHARTLRAKVNELRHSEALLQRKLEEMTILLDNVDTQIWYLTDPQTYGAVNKAHADFIGRSKPEIEGRNIYDIVNQKTASVCIDGNDDAFLQKSPVWSEVRIESTDGKVKNLSVVKSPKLDSDGNVDYVFCTAQDVTERRHTEAGLRMQTSAINAASDQIVITDIQGRIEFANPAFEQETGYTLQEVIGKNPRFLSSGKQEKAFYALLWNTILNGRTWHGEITNKRKDESQYVAEMTITPVRSEDGVIDRFVAINRNITEKKLFEKRMDYLAHYDSLTGLPNRLLIGHKLTQTLTHASHNDMQAAVLFLDLDGFKLVNDTMGHKTGDELLKSVAERLMKCCGESALLARMGGDEFVIVLPQVGSSEEVTRFAKRVLNAFSRVFDLEGCETFISTSIGISLYPAHGTDVETLVKNADAAMYRAKECGRDGYYFYDDTLNAAATERMAMENSLRRALEREEFVVYYQPRVDVVSGAILGAEALVRWRHPELGLVFPNEFIPLAEETGLVVPISEWVLRKACVQNKAWQDVGLPPIEIAVNISARQFQRRNILATVKSALNESGLDPKYLDIELTESTVMQRPDLAAAALGKMKNMGVRISIDDFGTGYSSLSYLKRFPVDALKVDRSFIRDITTNPDDAAITRAVVAMSHSLNLKVVAEGVETLEQLRYLFELGCDQMQGYFVSAALPADQFEEFFKQSIDADENEFRMAA